MKLSLPEIIDKVERAAMAWHDDSLWDAANALRDHVATAALTASGTCEHGEIKAFRITDGEREAWGATGPSNTEGTNANFASADEAVAERRRAHNERYHPGPEDWKCCEGLIECAPPGCAKSRARPEPRRELTYDEAEAAVTADDVRAFRQGFTSSGAVGPIYDQSVKFGLACFLKARSALFRTEPMRERIARAIHGALDDLAPWDSLTTFQHQRRLTEADAVLALFRDEAKP